MSATFDQPSVDTRDFDGERPACACCGDPLAPLESRVCDWCEALPRQRPCSNGCGAYAEVDDPSDLRPVLCNQCHHIWLVGE